ncbi:hypothetical protein Bbelb_133870 [Branchiostoma belcheri]|nr:hypothetical protein Bbelb_133870 [Branchiostoma belcheri]
METVDDSYIARAAPHLHNADRESEAADCIEPRAKLPLPVRTNHQAGMAGKETPMSELYGDTTGHKESAKPAGHRWGEEYGKESSKTVSRLYEDTTNINDSTSPVEDEDSDKNRPTPGLYEHGGQKSPDASSCLYENSTETSADHKETQSTMYEGGNPEIKHQTGSTANSGSIPSSTPQCATGTTDAELEHQYEDMDAPQENLQNGNAASMEATATGEAELEHHYENIDAPRENVQDGNPTSEEGADALKDDKGFCLTWMFPTTCSRLTCALAITAAFACIVALTVVGLKTTSNPKSQAPVFPTETHHLSHWSTSFVTSDSGNESSVPPTEAKREYDFKATFTTLGTKGRLGPTDLGQHYSGQDHDGLVTLNNGIQHFTVKHTGTYQIEAAGAAAGWDLSRPFRGKGALMKGTFQLNKVLRANLPSIETTVWQDTTFAGQDTSVECSKPDSPPDLVFPTFPTSGTRPRGVPRRRFRDQLKDTLLRCGIDEDNWEHLAEDRTKWRRTVMQGPAYIEDERRTKAEAKRQESKERLLRPRPPPTLPCDVLKILVGQEGGWMEEHACYFFRGAGGGGGTFVTRDDNTPLIIAGGGGSGSEMVHPECCFSDGTKETTGRNPSGRGVPVQSWPAYDGGGGGGLLTDGAGDFHTFKTFDGIMSGSNSGTAFVNGGKGGWGPCGGYGGFGGGGGGYGMIGGVGWGGGGGYSGGTRGGGNGFVQCAGGGGSFNSGTETFGQSGANGGPGYVIVTMITCT